MSIEQSSNSEEFANWHPNPAEFASSQKQESEVITLTPKEWDLSNREKSSGSNLGGGINNTEHVQLKDDGSAIFKPASGEAECFHEIAVGTYYKRERAAYLVDRILQTDLVPPTVIREIDGKIGSTQEFIPNSRVFTEHRTRKDAYEEALMKFWLFDYAIWNADRHFQNILVTEDNPEELIAIDHGLCFANTRFKPEAAFPGQAIPAEISRPYIELAHDSFKLKLLQDLLEELLVQDEAEACIARIKHLAEIFTESDFVHKRDLIYNPDEVLPDADFYLEDFAESEPIEETNPFGEHFTDDWDKWRQGE